MHRVVRSQLEDLLAARARGEQPAVAQNHVVGCSECLSEMTDMQEQASMLHRWRAPEELEPAPGFYARVLQRIEDTSRDSIWAHFLRSSFSRRLAYGSLTLTLLFGSYLVAHEENDGHIRGEQVVAEIAHEDHGVFGTPAEQRNAVLANFVSQ